MYEFKMPSLGADMDSGKLVQWNVKAGDSIKKGDIIAVVETQKAAVDVEVWVNGVIEKILLEPGEEDIPVGTVLALIRAEGEKVVVEKLPVKPVAIPLKEIPQVPKIAPAPPSEARRLHVSPAARHLAQQYQIDLSKIQGTGPRDVVTLSDVERLVPDKKLLMRQAIAASMERSNREIPHYFLETQIPMTKALQWMEAENLKRPPNQRLLYIALILKAIALALKKVPELNGFYQNGKAVPSDSIHVGVAVSLREGGLMAPALHDTDKKSLPELMQQLQYLIQRVRGGGLRSSELTDPTITVTSLGEEGVEKVFGLIYPPQVAIVGLGKIYETPQKVIAATLSADHRVSDGHRGAIFLNEVNRLMQEPEKL